MLPSDSLQVINTKIMRLILYIEQGTGTNLVNERGEAVVEGLDLILLLGADGLDGGVNFQVQRGQQALVDLDSCDRWSDVALASRREATTEAGPTTH